MILKEMLVFFVLQLKEMLILVSLIDRNIRVFLAKIQLSAFFFNTDTLTDKGYGTATGTAFIDTDIGTLIDSNTNIAISQFQLSVSGTKFSVNSDTSTRKGTATVIRNDTVIGTATGAVTGTVVTSTDTLIDSDMNIGISQFQLSVSGTRFSVNIDTSTSKGSVTGIRNDTIIGTATGAVTGTVVTGTDILTDSDTNIAIGQIQLSVSIKGFFVNTVTSTSIGTGTTNDSSTSKGTPASLAPTQTLLLGNFNSLYRASDSLKN